MNRISLAGLFTAGAFLVGCLGQDPSSSPAPEAGPLTEGPVIRLKGPGYDPSKVIMGVDLPPAFDDDTVPLPVRGVENPTVPLAKAAAAPTWEQLPGTAWDVAVGWYYYHLDTDNHIRIWDESTRQWNWVTQPPFPVFRISVAKKAGTTIASRANEHMVASCHFGGIYQFSPEADAWVYLAGSGGSWDVSVSPGGNIYYISGPEHRVFAWSGSSWSQVNATAYNLSAIDGENLVVSSTGGRLWKLTRNGSSWGSTYLDAWNVNDVCGDNLNGATYGGASSILMHVGTGKTQWYSANYAPYSKWTQVGGDYNTANLACSGTGTVFSTHNTVIFQHNKRGMMYRALAYLPANN